MTEVKDIAIHLISNAKEVIEKVPSNQISNIVNVFLQVQKQGKKVMVIGMGRSGLVGRAFAMRLMHLGFNVHVVGETITPALEEGDILFAISGSGATTFVVAAAEIAKRIGAKVIALTSYPDSPLGKTSDFILHIPGRVKTEEKKDYFSRQILGEHEPLMPLGTLFEVSSMIFLDSFVVELMKKIGKTEEELRARHAVIE